MDEVTKPKRHGSRWTADENRYLLELWYENESIKNIAETLERTEFAIICQLPWKAEVMLSRVISEVSDDKLLIEKATTLYLSDYPQLVDIEVDEKRILKAQKKREKERIKKREKIANLLKEIEIKSTISEKSGLEELIVKVFSTLNPRTLSLLEIKERLVWISSLALMFPIIEYDVLFAVYPIDGTKKKSYQTVANELEMPKHQVASYCRNAIRRLVMMISILGDEREMYSKWININKITYANMTLENPKLVFPEVTLNYENIPKLLSLVDDFEISNQEIRTLHNANIFCLGNLIEYEYEDLRFELKLDSGVARKVYSIKESFIREDRNA